MGDLKVRWRPKQYRNEGRKWSWRWSLRQEVKEEETGALGVILSFFNHFVLVSLKCYFTERQI